MAKRPPRGKARRPSREIASDLEAGIVSAARRDPVDVTSALRRVVDIRTDEERAVALVGMAFDVGTTTVIPFLDTLKQIDNEGWRARTIFSALQQADSRFTRELPVSAQDAVVALIAGITDEAARAAVLKNLPQDLPATLRARAMELAGALVDPLLRVQTLVALDTTPGDQRVAALLEMATRLERERERAAALAIVAPLLDQARLEEAFVVARTLRDAGDAGRTLVKIASRFADQGARARAHEEILALAPLIADPIRRFDVMAALIDLPPATRRCHESTLFELAATFEDPAIRGRALFMAGDFAQDEVARKNAFRAGIAAAHRVAGARERANLLALLRPVGPWLDPTVRAELRRAVEQIEDAEIQRELRSTLSRLFFYDRPSDAPESRQQPAGSDRPTVPAPVRDESWDVFISYATADLETARSLAFEMKSRGLRVFLSADDLAAAVGSTGWMSALDSAIARTRAMVVLVTEDSMTSNWVADEWRKYYRLMVDRQAGCLLPLRLSGPMIADLPLSLRMNQAIEVKDGRIGLEHVTQILELVRGAQKEPRRAAAP